MIDRLVRGPWLLVGLYLLLSLVSMGVWDVRGIYGLTGDEPHYLVIADSLVRDGSVEVSAAYSREITSPRFYVRGLAPPGSDLAAPIAHVVTTQWGLVSWHGIGLPAILAFPVGVAGVVGAKVIILASGLIVIAAAWRLATWTGLGGAHRSLAVVAVALAYPVLLASTQIYPDLWAGSLLLGALTWIAVPGLRTRGVTVAVSLGVGLLPWLGMKFAPAAAVVFIGMVYLAKRTTIGVLTVAGPAALLGSGLVMFNLTVFGSVTGAPVEGTLAWGSEFLMLVPGLLLDQNQGALFYNPVLWCGLVGIGFLWRRRRGLAAVWTAAFIAVWLPGAAHPGLYGLGSFNGRYSWAMALMMVVPTMVALAWLSRVWRLAFWTVVIGGVVFQAYVFVLSVYIVGTGPGTPPGLDLYTRPPGTWLESYSALWFPIHESLPALYDVAWADTFGPNAAWIIFAVLLLASGFLITEGRTTRSWIVALGVLPLLLVSVGLLGVIGAPGPRAFLVDAPSTSRPGVDLPGFPVTGPVHAMRRGTYEWVVDYQAEGTEIAGKWELVRIRDDVVLATGEMRGSSGEPARAGGSIPYFSFQPEQVVLRIGWYGESAMTTSAIGARRVG